MKKIKTSRLLKVSLRFIKNITDEKFSLK